MNKSKTVAFYLPTTKCFKATYKHIKQHGQWYIILYNVLIAFVDINTEHNQGMPFNINWKHIIVLKVGSTNTNICCCY